MDNSNVVFTLENVYYHYPYEEPVLKGIDLTIKTGERISILGVNGCGKSTLLKMFSGLLFPSQGTFKAFGDAVNEKTFNNPVFSKSYHKRIGFIFQNSDVQLFCSTVKEEIAFGPLQLNLPKEEVIKRVEDVMELLNIRHLEDKAPFKLSGGEKKKVGIAAVLVTNPEVLILDEPMAGLDPRTQRWLVEFLLALNQAGKTIITSTHNLELVQEISERAIVFNEDHTIAKDSDVETVLRDIDLLKRVNLVDECYHRHGEGDHTHYHMHKIL